MAGFQMDVRPLIEPLWKGLENSNKYNLNEELQKILASGDLNAAQNYDPGFMTKFMSGAEAAQGKNTVIDQINLRNANSYLLGKDNVDQIDALGDMYEKGLIGYDAYSKAYDEDNPRHAFPFRTAAGATAFENLLGTNKKMEQYGNVLPYYTGQSTQAPDTNALAGLLATDDKTASNLKSFLDASNIVNETGIRKSIADVIADPNLNWNEKQIKIRGLTGQLKGQEGAAALGSFHKMGQDDALTSLTAEASNYIRRYPNYFQNPQNSQELLASLLERYPGVNPEEAKKALSNLGVLRTFQIHDTGGSTPGLKQTTTLDQFGRQGTLGNEFDPTTTKLAVNVNPEGIPAGIIKAIGPEAAKGTADNAKLVRPVAAAQQDYLMMLELMKTGMKTGLTEPAKLFLKRVVKESGGNPDKMSEQELFNSAGGFMAAKATRQTDASPAVKQVEMIMQANPSLSASEAKNLAQIELGILANSKVIENHNNSINSYKQLPAAGDAISSVMMGQFGVIDPATDPKYQQAVSGIIKGISNTQQATGQQQTVSTIPNAKGLPEGTTLTDPKTGNQQIIRNGRWVPVIKNNGRR